MEAATDRSLNRLNAALRILRAGSVSSLAPSPVNAMTGARAPTAAWEPTVGVASAAKTPEQAFCVPGRGRRFVGCAERWVTYKVRAT